MTVDLREYMEALFDRDRAAREIADQEREKTAQALAAEREKVAQALAVSFARQIEQGDLALREHIDQQIGQIQAALLSVEKLMAQRHESSERAIAKAESATERRFDSVNEFRAQLSDQTRTFLPREVAETQFAEIRKTQSLIAARMDRTEGGSTERRQTIQGLSSQAQLMIGVVALIVTVLLANGVLK